MPESSKTPRMHRPLALRWTGSQEVDGVSLLRGGTVSTYISFQRSSHNFKVDRSMHALAGIHQHVYSCSSLQWEDRSPDANYRWLPPMGPLLPMGNQPTLCFVAESHQCVSRLQPDDTSSSGVGRRCSQGEASSIIDASATIALDCPAMSDVKSRLTYSLVL